MIQDKTYSLRVPGVTTRRALTAQGCHIRAVMKGNDQWIQLWTMLKRNTRPPGIHRAY